MTEPQQIQQAKQLAKEILHALDNTTIEIATPVVVMLALQLVTYGMVEALSSLLEDEVEISQGDCN